MYKRNKRGYWMVIFLVAWSCIFSVTGALKKEGYVFAYGTKTTICEKLSEEHINLYNKPGNTLITTDMFVREVSPDKKIVWNYYPPGDGSNIRANCAIRLNNGNTLITLKRMDRSEIEIIEVDKNKKIVWEYIDSPNEAFYAFPTPDEKTFVIADQRSHHVVIVNRKKQIIWEYRSKDLYPLFAVPLKSGEIIFPVEGKKYLMAVNLDKKTVWKKKFSSVYLPSLAYQDHEVIEFKKLYSIDEFGMLEITGDNKFIFHDGKLMAPTDFIKMVRLPKGHILFVTTLTSGGIAALEVDRTGKIVWEYKDIEAELPGCFIQRIGNVPLPLKK